jgi:acyl-CoA dehydrogenase family member 9
LNYAMDAMLYLTCGMLDRHDEDIMVETAICKLFCSEMGWRVVNDAMQIMGGEGYMTENEVERIFRDSRINLIVEGANEVMQSFVFAYGGKQLAEYLLSVRENAMKFYKPSVLKAAAPLALELFLGIKRSAPKVSKVDPSLRDVAEKLSRTIRDFSHQFKLASKHYGEKIIARQAVQARLADAAMWLHAWACSLSKLNQNPTQDRAAAMHLFDIAEHEVRACFAQLFDHADDTLPDAAKEAMAFVASLPNSDYSIPEASPNAQGTGRNRPTSGIKQFPPLHETRSLKEETRSSFQPSSVSLHPSSRTRI